MNRYLIHTLALVLIFPLFKVNAQPAGRDSLIAVWKDNSLSDTSRINALSTAIDYYYVNTQPDSAKYYSEVLYELTQKSLIGF